MTSRPPVSPLPVPSLSSTSGSSNGGLSRSSRSSSLAVLASGLPSPATDSLSLSSHSSSSRAVSPAFSGPRAASSASSSAESTCTSTNAGFVITSRPKLYRPPTASPPPSTPVPLPLASTSSSVPASPPLSGPARTPISDLPSGVATPAGLSHHPSNASSYRSSRQSSPPPNLSASTMSAAAPGEPKTTLTLSSSIDSKGRRMVNQYVRLKTIGQGSHGKVWLCAEPVPSELDEEEQGEGLGRTPSGKSLKREGKEKENDLWDGLDSDVQYCAIKSVARDGPGRGKSLRAAKGRKQSIQDGSNGIGADDKVKREVAIMKRLDHKNVVRLKEVIDDAKSKKVFMVLEFMAGGQVVWQDEHKQPTMSVEEARRTFRDVVLGLEYLHYQGIIHRDIKPANLLWTEDHSTVKISDFGVSHVSDALLRATPNGSMGDDDKALRKTAGSPAFFAPELCHPAEYSSTPRGHGPDEEYFGPDDVEHLGSSLASIASPISPSIRYTSTTISQPLPSPDPSKARTRPAIGKGIDVWALGVTLYCLLFGDTPFMAKTEYELYNVIVRQAIRVPERMGKEGAWTGVGQGWEGCGDGVEGREVVDLLGRLLEKDPSKRIGLDEVKKHPWVLRGISCSPDSWLCDTDPAQRNAVVITEEEIEHATQERGAVDAIPQIRNRPGLRRALHAALVRFPAFSRMKSTRATPTHARSRSKSASSTSASGAADNASEFGSEKPSRHPSDATSRKKTSNEFGVDIRRIISGGRERDPSPTRNGNGGAYAPRGGWGARLAAERQERHHHHQQRSSEPGSPFPELSRSVSASSINPSRRRHHLFPSRKNSESDSRAESPAPPSDSEGGPGRRKISQIFSRLGSGRRTPRPSKERSGSLSDDESLPPTPHPVEAPLPPLPPPVPTENYDDTRAARSAFDILSAGPDEEDMYESSDYYSSDDDDELFDPPVIQGDGISGWRSHFYDNSFARDDGFDEDILEEDEKKPQSTFTIENATPRASTQIPHDVEVDTDTSPIPPPLVRQSSETPSKSKSRSNSVRDGSIRSGFDTHGAKRWQTSYDDDEGAFDDDDEDDEGAEIVFGRRRRVVT
ncbi:hypothetical protein MNV49_002830 [Pseudohyphozyma bogoriensis]|nr:hypothetical protein MNV49_002830 [Pseudohyphozyma bogoriensis]